VNQAQANNALAFLQRVNLTGAEAAAMVEVQMALKKIATGEVEAVKVVTVETGQKPTPAKPRKAPVDAPLPDGMGN